MRMLYCIFAIQNAGRVRIAYRLHIGSTSVSPCESISKLS